MATYRRVDVTMVGGVYVVQFLRPRIMDAKAVLDFGRDVRELLHEDVSLLLFDFSGVQIFLSAAASFLRLAERHVHERSRPLRLCCVELGTLLILRTMRERGELAFEEFDTREAALETPWLEPATAAR